MVLGLVVCESAFKSIGRDQCIGPIFSVFTTC